MIDGTAVAIILHKVLGALAGTFFALVLLPPRTRRELAARAAMSPVAGIIFEPLIREQFTWDASPDHILMGGSLAALLSWWVLGAVIRIARLRLRDQEKAGE